MKLKAIKVDSIKYKLTTNNEDNILGWFVIDTDGSYYYQSRPNPGTWSSYALRKLADLLDLINEQEEIK